jgi:hypothetical protein
MLSGILCEKLNKARGIRNSDISQLVVARAKICKNIMNFEMFC